MAARINYTDLPVPAAALDPGDSVSEDDAELASFAALHRELASGELPDPPDLPEITGEPTDQDGQR